MELLPNVVIPDGELEWSYARSGGPGGQNVNKVSTKAVLRWKLGDSEALPEAVKARLIAHHKRAVTVEGDLVLRSQRYRDQDRNREDCLAKLRAMIESAQLVPKPRRATRPTRASKLRKVAAKKHRAAAKSQRQVPREE